ncbi:hypothetical protein WJX73_003842 [Symbiochloris irregularis]|uniref:Uncharacterized protein n=1 Tax=Symbiochloris irregularis TaxID=706552 RepID=A0AAW1PLN9_9CHLO
MSLSAAKFIGAGLVFGGAVFGAARVVAGRRRKSARRNPQVTAAATVENPFTRDCDLNDPAVSSQQERQCSHSNASTSGPGSQQPDEAPHGKGFCFQHLQNQVQLEDSREQLQSKLQKEAAELRQEKADHAATSATLEARLSHAQQALDNAESEEQRLRAELQATQAALQAAQAKCAQEQHRTLELKNLLGQVSIGRSLMLGQKHDLLHILRLVQTTLGADASAVLGSRLEQQIADKLEEAEEDVVFDDQDLAILHDAELQHEQAEEAESQTSTESEGCHEDDPESEASSPEDLGVCKDAALPNNVKRVQSHLTAEHSSQRRMLPDDDEIVMTGVEDSLEDDQLTGGAWEDLGASQEAAEDVSPSRGGHPSA